MSGYAFVHEGNVFTPEGTADIADPKAHNAALEAAELAAWAQRPDTWALYVADGNDVTTWLGTKLGTIVARRKFRTNMSRNMVALTIRGTNGATYHGRYGADWSQLCRVRKSRG